MPHKKNESLNLFTCPEILFKICYTYFDPSHSVRESKIQVTEWPADLNVSNIGLFFFYSKWSTGSHNSSQDARTLARSLFTENVDVDSFFFFKINRKKICCDEAWDIIVKCLKAEREADKNTRGTIRVFQVEVERRR